MKGGRSLGLVTYLLACLTGMAQTSFVDRRPLETATGANAYDGEQVYRAGGRVELQQDKATRLSLLGQAYGGPLRQQNLLSPRHLEFGGSTTFLTPLYVPRSLFLRAGWSF